MLNEGYSDYSIQIFILTFNAEISRFRFGVRLKKQAIKSDDRILL